MSDLIERRAAIEVADAVWSVTGDKNVAKVWDQIKDLPSAQPEIIRCKDCKQFRRWVDTDICFCDITESEMSDNDYCSRAERRTDDSISDRLSV